jgi:3-hydroxyisobutyrate dehydrogenase-like beta-hydroxyacid dehydrogenase
VLEGFADPVVHCGELGNGMRAKLARNLIIYTDWMVAWEAARLALAAGVPLDRFVECVTASDRWVKPHMHLVDHGIGLGSEANAERTAGYADKDLRAALALGDELGLDLPAAQLALARFRAVAGLD